MIAVDLNNWKGILQRQISQLKNISGVENVRHTYVRGQPPFVVYNSSKPHYSEPDYEYVEFTLRCKAVMDCHPQKSKTEPYKISETDVKISSEHELAILFPRGFPKDAIGWGFFFTKEVPMYNNFTCIGDDRFYKFNSQNRCPDDWGKGIICIGAASSPTGTPMHELVLNLKSYLLMEQESHFVRQSMGGNNDGGFDPALMSHIGLNFKTIKQALDSWSDNPGPNKPRRLGNRNKKPRRLGK